MSQSVILPDDYFERFETPKYRSRNPAKRWMMRRFAERLHALFEKAAPEASVAEIGCGEGFLTGFLSERHPQLEFTALDQSEKDLQGLARKFPRVRTIPGDIYDLAGLGAGYSLTICAEVLEHLEEPERALEQIAGLGSHRSIFTVPNEPWFMLTNLAAGNNVTRLGNDPEHINHFTPRSFRKLLEPRFEVLELTTSYPWILALTRRWAGPRASRYST